MAALWYLGWCDFEKSKPVVQKIREGMERYADKFGEKPNIVLVNQNQPDIPITLLLDGVELRLVEYVRRNHFWIAHIVGEEA
jgi:hypothetical protein